MAQVINTNSLSLLTQNNLTKSQSSLNTAIQRLSSGLRINSAKDDAAGQAIANRFTANIKGLTQASRNANDGISMAQTTEGALTEINTNLQRIRELAVQASNATNSPADKVSIQDEITQRLQEITRTSEQTDFNGTKVLSADAKTTGVQIGANDGEVINIGLREISAETLGLTGFDARNIVLADKIGASMLSGTNFDVTKTAAVQANTFVPTAPAPGPETIAAGVYKLATPIAGSAAVAAAAAVNYSGSGAALAAANGTTPGANVAIVSYDDSGTTKYAAVDNAGATTKAVAVTVDAAGVFTAGADITADIAIINGGTPTAVVDGGVFKAAVTASAATAAVDYAVKNQDGKYFALATSPVTGDLTWDSASAEILAANIDVAGGTVSTVDIKSTLVPTALTISNGPIAGGVTITDFTLYKRDDVAAETLNAADGTGTLTGYAMKGSDNKYYAVDLTSTTGLANAKAWQLTATVDAATIAEVSAGNITGAVGAAGVIVSSETVASNDDLQNISINPGVTPPAVTSDGVYALTGGGYAVKGNDAKYYAATVATDGKVSWDSSSAALGTVAGAAGNVDVAGGAVTTVKNGTSAAATFTGLAAGETLHEIKKADGTGSGKYVVKGGTTDAPTYKNATLGTADATGNIAVTKTDNATVDPLKMLDRALANVDTLRSSLGAVQNRFDSIISNLGTTITNLTSSRSRIEDADYAVEVSNMTRANILQQAGTSVLAQANQTTQGVLSLLR